MTNELKRFLHFLFFTNIYTFLIVSLIFIFIFLGERYNKKNEFQQQVRTINFFIDQQDISPMVKLKFLKCMKENFTVTYEGQSFNLALMKTMIHLLNQDEVNN